MYVLCRPDGEGLPVFLCQGASSLSSPEAFSSLLSSGALCLCPRARCDRPIKVTLTWEPEHLPEQKKTVLTWSVVMAMDI